VEAYSREVTFLVEAEDENSIFLCCVNTKTEYSQRFTRNALLARLFEIYSIQSCLRGGVAYFHVFTLWKQLSFQPSTMETITTISALEKRWNIKRPRVWVH